MGTGPAGVVTSGQCVPCDKIHDRAGIRITCDYLSQQQAVLASAFSEIALRLSSSHCLSAAGNQGCLAGRGQNNPGLLHAAVPGVSDTHV
jgi:hypothetical protein